MKKRILLLMVVMFLLVLNITFASNIGYELLDDNSVLYIWNTQDDYFFDVDSGIQLTNHYEDYWTRNIFCIGYYNDDEWNKIKCSDELTGFEKSIESDDLTYVTATLWKDITYGSYDLRFGVQYHLGLDDETLSITIYGKNIGIDIPFDLGFAWKITDWDIPSNEKDDYLIINNTGYAIKGTYDLMFRDMEESFFKGRDTTYAFGGEFLRVDWNENLNYAVKMYGNGIQEDFYVALLINAGHFNPQQEKSTTFQWIDAVVLGTSAGFVTEAPVADPDSSSTVVDYKSSAIKDTAPAEAVRVTEIGWYCSDATDDVNFEVGIYDHNITDNNPEAVVGSLSQTNAKGTDAGWKRVTGLDIEITGGTVYWIAMQLDDTDPWTQCDYGAGGKRDFKDSQTTLTDPWGTTGTTHTTTYAFYAVWEEDPLTYTNNQTNITTLINNDWVQINTTWTASTVGALNYTWCGNNFTGTWINETPVARAGLTSVTHTNITQFTAGIGKTGCYQCYANDTSNNSAETTMSCITAFIPLPNMTVNIKENITLVLHNLTIQANLSSIVEFNLSFLNVTTPEGFNNGSEIGLSSYTWDYAVIMNSSFYHPGKHNITFHYCNNDVLNCVDETFYYYSYDTTETYNSTVYEGISTNFVLVINSTGTLLSGADFRANLVYNNTFYTPTISVSGQLVTFFNNISIPLIDSDVTSETRTFYWNYSMDGDKYNTSTFSQTVNSISIGDCGNLTNTTALNITFRDEVTDNLVTTNFDGIFEMWIGDTRGDSRYESFNKTGSSSYQFCIYPNTTTINIDAEFLYDATGYPVRTNYLCEKALNATGAYYDFYHLSTANATAVTLTLTDDSDDPLVDYYVDLLRWYPGTNEYRTVEVTKTNDDGRIRNQVEMYDVFYMWRFRQCNAVLRETGRNQIAITSLTYQIMEDIDYLDSWASLNDISFNLAYDNSTTTFTFGWSDVGGEADYYCLKVVRSGGLGMTTLSDECSTAKSGALEYTLAEFRGRILATAYAKESGSNLYVFALDTYELITSKPYADIFGETGLLLSGIFMMTMSFIGLAVAGVTGMVLFMMIGLGAFAMIGMIGLNLTVFVGLVVTAGVIIWRIRK